MPFELTSTLRRRALYELAVRADRRDARRRTALIRAEMDSTVTSRRSLDTTRYSRAELVRFGRKSGRIRRAKTSFRTKRIRTMRRRGLTFQAISIQCDRRGLGRITRQGVAFICWRDRVFPPKRLGRPPPGPFVAIRFAKGTSGWGGSRRGSAL